MSDFNIFTSAKLAGDLNLAKLYLLTRHNDAAELVNKISKEMITGNGENTTVKLYTGCELTFNYNSLGHIESYMYTNDIDNTSHMFSHTECMIAYILARFL